MIGAILPHPLIPYMASCHMDNFVFFYAQGVLQINTFAGSNAEEFFHYRRLGFDIVLLRKLIPTFRRNVFTSIFRIKGMTSNLRLK